ncbi:MAG: putative DNA binding domain-containing protein, partial [Acidobacteria bacterium]|nr:putative DNA binding domain-containing protein [Acidobacteriota bacterium]
MLTKDELRTLIADHESDRVELTTSTTKTDKFGEAVCAFANDFPNHGQPGYLIIGVDDKARFSGLTVGDELLKNLGALRSNVNIEPLPAMTVQKYSLPEGEVAVVQVLPSDLPPVRYKGRVWIRVGPARRGASQQEERILIEKRTALQRTFDLRPCTGCTMNDLILDLFLVTYLPAAVERSVIEENNRTDAEQMASLRFYDLAAGCPTNAGALLFGRDPLRCVPG